MRAPHALLLIYAAASLTAAVTYFAGLGPAPWIVALARSGHGPVPALELTLVLAFWQACFAPLGSLLAAVVLRARGLPAPAMHGGETRRRVMRGLVGLGLLSLGPTWLALNLAAPALYASLPWLADGVTLVALFAIAPGVAFLIDTVLPFEVFEGTVTAHIQFGRPRSADYLLTIEGRRARVPRAVWDAVPHGARVRVLKWGFSDHFARLERR